MTLREIIQRKRDGGSLSEEEIRYFIRGYLSSEAAEYHVAALLMAIFFRGMTAEETLALTLAMRDSGKVLDLGSIPGKKVDKHSTGGVGDKTSLIVAPIAAACGVIVPMITGRALGHTGGTLDKLESIPGFRADLSPEKIVEQLAAIHAVIMGQTEDLAPADRKIYALRDVTATVESIPLITASILSKKLAEGIDGLVLDVKTGSGAFMQTPKSATALVRSIVDICRLAKTKVVALITDMEQPLGHAVGNAIEVRECIEVLNGNGPDDLKTLSILIAAHMIRLAGIAKTLGQATELARGCLLSGEAAKCFRKIVRAQGGDGRVVDDPDRLPKAVHVYEFRAKCRGFVASADAKLLGLASNALGAGRRRVDDAVDPAVGLWVGKKRGDQTGAGEVLCNIHWNEEARLREALPMIEQAFRIQNGPPRKRPLVHASVVSKN